MWTITEDYVSFEIAKLLKKKGFKGYSILTTYDENAANAYIKELQEKHLPYSSDDPKLKEFYYTVPTLQMAMKWLREVHNIDIFPWKIGKGIYSCAIFNSNTGQDLSSDKDFPTEKYEETAEAAVRYCLENLI